MKNICINTAKKYNVIVGYNLISEIGNYISVITKSAKIAIISDSNVWPLYGEMLCNGLHSSGYETCSFVFEAGEERKNANTYFSILNFLAENKLTRSDLMIALGGGVVGDITGFSAATFLRGIPYIQIPTSLLAMVDSSVGGKTAIDLPPGKNLAGAFYQPTLVLCDLNTLNTLPLEIFRDGCAEIIKYGVLYDLELFNHLAEHETDFNREYVIAKCIEWKNYAVSADEFDRGERQKLNLGHTVGHGIEKQSNFSVTHGQAVAIGMDIVTKAACSKKICSDDIYLALHSVLHSFGLPTTTSISAKAIYDAMLSDKKRFGATLNLIIPTRIGDCIIHPTPIDQLQSFIEAGL